MRRKLLLVLALILCASVTHAGMISRGVKGGSGTTAFVDGTAASASEVNYDFDALFGLVNGQIDNTNIVASAGIVLSKLDQTAAGLDADIVDDYSATEGEQATVSDPGTSEATTLALNLQTELAQLRFKIEQLTVGTSATDVAAAADTDTDASWIDGPYRPGNLIYNGGFDTWSTADCSPCAGAGDGWDLEATPDLADTAKTASEGYGSGMGMLITGNGAALEGVSQTLTGLKASTRYFARTAVRPTTGDSCTLFVEDADTNDLTVVSASDNAWEVISGTFQTDSTPTAVNVQVLATADGDICLVDDIAVYEINTDPVTHTGKVHCYDSTIAVSENLFASGTFTDSGVTCAVTVPAPGYMITVRGRISAENGGGTDGDALHSRLRENCGSAATKDGSTETAVKAENGVTDMVTANLFWVNDAPVAGTTCTYTLEGMGDGNAFHRNDFGADADSDVIPITWVDVIMEPTG